MAIESSITEKSNIRPSVTKLTDLLSLDKNDLFVILIYEAAVGVFSLVVPIAIQMLVNTVIFTFLLQPIVILATLVVGFLALASTFKLIQTHVVETLQTRIFTRVSLNLAHRLPRTKIEAFDANRGTELLNRFFEVITIQKGLALILVDGIAIVLQSIIGMILLAFYHPALLGFDFALIVSIFVVVFVPMKKGVKTSIRECGGKYAVAAWLEEIARNPVTFKLGGLQEYALSRANEATHEYLEKRRDHFRILRQQIRGTLLVQTVISGLFLGIGSFLVIQKQLTLGQLVASEIIVTIVLARVGKLGKYIETYYDLVASADKITTLLELPIEQTPSENFFPCKGAFSVTLNQVCFNYPGSLRRTLDRINLRIEPGDRIGIKGGNGSGKSTLFDLILGMRPTTSGSIEVADQDLRDFDLSEMRRLIALVRDLDFIEGTIIDNIRMGRAGITIPEIRKVLDDLSLLDEIASLPDGLATRLSGSQNPLSAGQAQRLMLARALIGSPKLLLLDEALDAIDASAREKVLTAIFKPSAPWTIIVASHRAELLAGCTRVYCMGQGHLSLNGDSGENLK